MKLFNAFYKVNVFIIWHTSTFFCFLSSPDTWLYMPTSPRRLTSLNLGKGRCIGWQRSVKTDGSKARHWELQPLASSQGTTSPPCPGQWAQAWICRVENDTAAQGNLSCRHPDQRDDWVVAVILGVCSWWWSLNYSFSLWPSSQRWKSDSVLERPKHKHTFIS